MAKLTKEEKQILDNFEVAIPKLSKKQKDKLLIGSEFIVVMANNQKRKST